MLTSVQNGVPASPVLSLLVPKTKAVDTTDSFAKEFATKLEQFLNQPANGSGFQIDIEPGQGQNSASRQFIVTVKDAASGSPGGSNVGAPANSPAGSVLSTTTPLPDARPPGAAPLAKSVVARAASLAAPAASEIEPPAETAPAASEIKPVAAQTAPAAAETWFGPIFTPAAAVSTTHSATTPAASTAPVAA